MNFLSIGLWLVGLFPFVVLGAGILLAMMYRRVVPTNMVHIVQRKSRSVAYGRGKDAGNVYYAWPSWLPVIGVTITEMPESIFDVRLGSYDAYDQARLPFVVDVVGFFKVSDAETAAQRVSSFRELVSQLESVLQGAVRRILATNTLEHIMESRSDLGEQFTKEVSDQIREWGVEPVKTIEFMDLRDAHGSTVIANIMAKEKSRIERESRIAVAENQREAELREIDARRVVDVQRQEAEQLVGLRTAEKDKEVGIANELAAQQVQEAARLTAEKKMSVEAVMREREADIARNVQVTKASAEKDAAILAAEAQLQETLKDAEGIAAKGRAEAEAQEKLLMAPVTAQITLAQEIGDNTGYQGYLLNLEQIKAGQAVGMEMAQALAKADLKVISSGGAGVSEGVASLADTFTLQGGTKLTGMLAALASTPEGKALVGGLATRLAGSHPGASAE